MAVENGKTLIEVGNALIEAIRTTTHQEPVYPRYGPRVQALFYIGYLVRRAKYDAQKREPGRWPRQPRRGTIRAGYSDEQVGSLLEQLKMMTMVGDTRSENMRQVPINGDILDATAEILRRKRKEALKL